MSARRRIRRWARPAALAPPAVTGPLSDWWGLDRGQPIDRWYIERFLEGERAAIRGHVLEVRDRRYTTSYGTNVTRSDVIDIDPTNGDATIVADLARATAIPADTYDCFILVQTLQFIFEVRAALAHAARILAPGGTLLCTVPAISRIGRRYVDTEFWRFTAAGCTGLVSEAFPGGGVDVRSYGNVLACSSFLYGLAVEDVREADLLEDDPFFPLVIAVRASKPGLGDERPVHGLSPADPTLRSA